jgi:hypothetical protein
MSVKLKVFGAAASLVAALAAAPAAQAEVNVSIYQSSGTPAVVGTYGSLVGSFLSPGISFGESTGWHWTPLGQNNEFAAVFTGVLNVASTGTYTIGVTADDGEVTAIDGKPVIDNWVAQGPTLRSTTLELTAGLHPFRIDYFECCGNPSSGIDMVLPQGVTIAPVPEPESFAMMLAGLGILGGIARRNKKQA